MGYDESASSGQALIAGFREGLQKLGWTEGRPAGSFARYGYRARVRGPCAAARAALAMFGSGPRRG